jgi:F-type H+-transporting ATPase subunit a
MAHEHVPNAFEHVLDTNRWVFFDRLFGAPVEWKIPPIPMPWGDRFGEQFSKFQITKFMLLELIAAGLIILIYVPLARRARNGELPKGWRWNMFECLLTFVRNEIARPNLGGPHHAEEADKYVPYLWTTFLFILFCNLLGLIPFGGSPTASIYATLGLAVIALVMMHGAAIVKVGPIKYVKSLWPHLDVPYVGWLFSGMIFVIEFIGTFIKSGVLAVRLFANLFAGHLVLAFLLLFIYMVGMASIPQPGHSFLWGGVTIASVLGNAALSLLELFIAFLQAYVFTFLTAVFMGMSLHPEH